MSDTTLDTTLPFAALGDDARWSPRGSLLFVVAASSALWSLIALALWALS